MVNGCFEQQGSGACGVDLGRSELKHDAVRVIKDCTRWSRGCKFNASIL